MNTPNTQTTAGARTHSISFTCRNGQTITQTRTIAAHTQRLAELDKAEANRLRYAPTHSGDSTFADNAEAKAIRDFLGTQPAQDQAAAAQRSQPCAEQWALMSDNVRAEYLAAGFSDPTAPTADDQDAAIIAHADVSVRPRIRRELLIVRRILADLRRAGYALSVDDGGDITRGTDAQLVEAIFGVDEAHLFARRDGKRSFVFFVLGNGDGNEVVCDYGVSLEPIMQPVSQWIEDMENRGE